MNSLEQQFPMLHETNKLRDQLLAESSDDDLAFKLPGDNPPLGELFRELGEVEYAYIQGFKNFKHDFEYRNLEAGLATDKARLAAWFKSLDDDLEATLAALSEADIQTKIVARQYWNPSVTIAFHTYRESILIFAAKASVYFRALGKPLPQQVLWWIS